MLQELRQLTLKHRDEHLTNMKEIAQLRRKEKATSDTVKKLEKSNEIQKMMLKKRTDEINSSKQKLKKIMNSLKRAPTPNKISKSHSRPASPAHGLRQRNHPSTNEYLASVSSPMRVSVAKVIRDADAGQIEVKAQFKKQMVDKELTSAISYKRTQRELEKLQFCRNRLIEEQKELLSERKRVVEAHFQKTKNFDEKSPQYMDERVQSIDKEVASIDSSMSAIESSLRSKIGAFKDMAITSAIDASWENALNLVKTLTRAELEATIAYFFEDLIELRITEDELYQEIESKDNLMEGLRENVNALKEKIRPDEIFVDDVSENLTKPSLKSSPSIVTKSSDLEEAVHIQTINEIQGEQNFGTRIIPQRGLSRTTSALLPPLEPKRLSQGPPFIIETARIPSLEESKEDDHKQRKKFDILTLPGSSDVFKRLAQSHTLASQAKVIQRSSMDKDLTDSCVSEDSKRRTLSDMTNPVYSDKI